MRRPLEVLHGAAAHCALDLFTARLTVAEQWLLAGNEPGAAEVARRLGNGIAASESCVTALYVALRFLARPFLEMQKFATGIGGDVDTIGAMAGALWGAANGVGGLPVDHLAKLEQLDRLRAAALDLHARILPRGAPWQRDQASAGLNVR